MKRPRSGGGWPAIWYTVRKARASGGVLRMLGALRSRNACKTCALGMGGQKGGMTNEAGRFPEVCKKSVQAMAADMQGKLRPSFFREFPFSKLAAFSPRELEASGRITAPLYAGPGDASYREVGWDDALDRIGAKMRATKPEESFFYASGRSSNEAGFLLQLVARLYGTNNVNNCSFFCHNASGVGLKQVLGSGAGTVTLEDLAESDLVFVIGGNPASNHPRLMRTLVELKRRGGKVIVVNPIREVGLVNFRVPSDVRSLLLGSSIADEYVQPHIGGDIGFFCAIAKAVLEAGAADERFIGDCTEGFEAWRASIESLPWAEVVASSGVSEVDIRRSAALYARSRAAVFCWTMGITHHEHGVSNVHAIANAALVRGMLGRPGAGLLPLRGHSNVQGMGTVGVSPVPTAKFLAAMEQRFNVKLPTAPGMDTLACVRRAAAGGTRFALHLGGNLYGSCPDAAWAGRALGGIDLTVFLSTTLNTGHIRGRGKESIVLPVLARDEEQQPTTQESMFSYVRLSDGGARRFEGPRAEVEVIAAIARRVLGAHAGFDFAAMERHASIREAIAAVVPDLAQLAAIDQTKQEFVIPGRIMHAPRFPTATGRARFHVTPLPGQVGGGGAGGGAGGGDGFGLRLMTIRSEGQFNTVVYEDEDIYRGQERRDVVMMNPSDLRRLALRENDRVRVESATGAMDGLFARALDIRPGNAAMYYPEANVLVPAVADPQSKTPPFKNIAITVRPSRSLNILRPPPAAAAQHA